MLCEKCKTPLRPGDAFCGACGAPIGKTNPPEGNAVVPPPPHPPLPCEVCGMMVPPYSAVCLACGQPLILPEDGGSHTAPPVSELAAPAPAPEQPTDMQPAEAVAASSVEAPTAEPAPVSQGEELAEPAPPRCPGCQAILHPGDRFCEECGQKLV